MTQINDELRAYTGFTDNVIDGFNKQEKSAELAAHIAWHVPGGAGVVGRDKMVEKIYGEYSGASVAETPTQPEISTDGQEDDAVEPSTAEVSDTVK